MPSNFQVHMLDLRITVPLALVYFLFSNRSPRGRGSLYNLVFSLEFGQSGNQVNIKRPSKLTYSFRVDLRLYWLPFFKVKLTFENATGVKPLIGRNPSKRFIFELKEFLLNAKPFHIILINVYSFLMRSHELSNHGV